MKLKRVKVVGWFSKPSIDQRTLFDPVNNISIVWGTERDLGRVKLTITNMSQIDTILKAYIHFNSYRLQRITIHVEESNQTK